jgi:hypothetical protein
MPSGGRLRHVQRIGSLATKSFGSVMSIVQDFSTSPVASSFHSSHSPAKVIGSPSAQVKYQGCLPVAVSCQS